ncbi:MAG: right-handed parallel beta-helix repeat-containing protein [Planctomycetota bacterium]
MSARRAFTFNNGEGPGTVINGFTIINGGLILEHGGAIYVGPDSSPTIVNVNISNCQVAYGSGGAIYVDANSSPTFTNVTIDNCATIELLLPVDPNDPNSLVNFGGGGNGGGVYLNINTSPVFTDCSISDCSTVGSGGAVYSGSYSSAVFNHCFFTGNSAEINGGGFYHASNSGSTLDDCLLIDNEANYSGGAIYYNVNCESEVTECNISGNRALGVVTTGILTDPNDPNTLITFTDDSPLGAGGGIYCDSESHITVKKSIFAQNSAEDGGAFYLDSNSVAEVVDCNIADNTAARGAGLFCIDCPDSKIDGCLINDNESVHIEITFIYVIWDPNNPTVPPIVIEPNDPAFDPNDPNLTIFPFEDRSGVAQGGGIYSFAGPALIRDCQISYNTTTTSGGGIYLAGGEYNPTELNNCLITSNTAGRDGGGVSNNWQNELRISNCTIAENAATDANSLGGGLYCSYDSNTVAIDSVIWNNMADMGSQIALGSGDPVHPLPSKLDISYSDIDLSDGFDTAIYVEDGSTIDGWIPNYPTGPWEADKYNIDEIPYFTDGYYLSQIAAGQDLDSPCVDAGSGDANDPDIGMSDYTTRTDGEPDVNIVDMGYHYPNPIISAVMYQLTVTVVDANGTEITDPNLIHGYVDPNDGLFPEDSIVQLTAFPDPTYRVKAWTGTDDDLSRAPTNTVTMTGDMYVTVEFEPDIYHLTTMIVGPNGKEITDPNLLHGTLDPNSGPKFAGVIQLTATPDDGYRVKRWIGTDKDSSWGNNNTVTLDRDKTVKVEFELDVIRILKVPTEYETIEEAVEAADQLGTKIIVDRGIYDINNPDGIDFQGKNVTLMSTDPDDPDVIANTIIECNGFRLSNTRAFHFHSGEDQNTKVIGFTIRNGYINGGNGTFGLGGDLFHNLQPSPYELQPDDDPDPNTTPPRAERGGDAEGDAYGGGILCENGSSPLIKNCIITNCTVTGAHGGDGAWGVGAYYYLLGVDRDDLQDEWEFIPPTADPADDPETSSDGQWGGHGGTGIGNGYGGAIACLEGSCPTILNCIIKDNSALGGMGGTGGNGGTTSGGNESGGGYGGDANGDGIGGGIYSDGRSCPIITNCTFENNIAATGTPGEGGAVGFGDNLDPRAWAGSTGDPNSSGGIAGGAVYFGDDADANIVSSIFTGNQAYELSISEYFGIIGFEPEPVFTYTRGGALYSANSNAVVLKDCEFEGNLGGAVYCNPYCSLDVNDCSFSGNADANEGSAIYIAENVEADVKNSRFTGNSALIDGGAIHTISDADFTNCSFVNNIAGENGGAIEGYYDTNTPDTHIVLKFNFENCSFIGNQASKGFRGWGGGVRLQDFDAVFRDCYFINNEAKIGGGLSLTRGTVDMSGGIIKGNKAVGGSGVAVITDQDLIDAYMSAAFLSESFIASFFDASSLQAMLDTGTGFGGGIYCNDTNATIENCTLSDNSADGVNGSGGAISLFGGKVSHSIKNCLLTGNSAVDDGGAISIRMFAKPEIQNCTFVSNRTDGMGGAVFSDWSSDATITDSIFQDNSKGAVADGEKDFDNAEENDYLRNTTAKFCLFYRNPDGDYVLYDPNSEPITIITGPELDDTNIKGDPLFIAGTLGEYYLSQTESGQNSDSPAVDAGSDLAENLGLSDLTTRTDGVGDSGQVDIGYHYLDPDGLPRYTLTTRVVSGQGTIEPPDGVYYTGTVIKLTGDPSAGWIISKWSGTDNDLSRSSHNTVTILNADAVAEIEFYLPAVINVPDDHETIQGAVTSANDGDRIIVDTGVYYGGYMSYALTIDKSVTITSSNPHDPNIVAATILRGNRVGVSPFNYIGVVFGPTTDASTVLNGFTIEDFGGTPGQEDDGDRGDGHPNGYDGVPIDGAGIYIQAGASPVIKNCIIRNNFLLGGYGGNGENATDSENAGRGGWGGWARGAGIYCGPYTNVKLINCTIEGNEAQGGNGGNGGNYAFPGGYGNYGGNYSIEGSATNPVYSFNPDSLGLELVEGNLYESWEWDLSIFYSSVSGQLEFGPYIADYRYYSGYGGGVYCDFSSNVTFEHCEIRGNRTYGGMSGQGGEIAPSGRPLEPIVPYELPSYGAGVYVAADSTAIFDGCTFEDNVASETLVDPNHRLSPYRGYGGGVSAENSALIYFADCNFVDNGADTGGAIHTNSTDVTIIDCNIVSNNALRGAGFIGDGGSVDIRKTIVANNQTILDVNDPNDDEVLSIGAGLCIMSADSFIQDCNISGNRADGAGGGIYLRGANDSIIRNCLIINNSAGRDGGGISTNWYTLTTIANCTFSGNAASGAAGEVGNTGLGGALYCGYESETTITDSILWNNFGLKGQEIAVGSGFELDPLCGKVEVFYSNVKLSTNNVWADEGCELDLGPENGNISDDPLFVEGPDGRYYLSHAGVIYEDIGQSETSPCVDSGSDYASHVGLLGYTTRTDRIRDTGIVDMGYHYNTEDKCRLADFIFDGVIDQMDLEEFLNLAEKWLELPCSEENDWCDGADIRTDGEIDDYDLSFLVVDCNGAADINAPTPDPAEWEIEPYISTLSASISMRAEEAFDAWSRDVQYYFECVTPGGHDSGWQTDQEYTDTGLDINQGYGYRVRAMDKFGNVTAWSEIIYAGIDTIPPAPAPYIETFDPNITSIAMTASIAYDENGVEYYFENKLGDANDSGWQVDPNYTVTGLDPNTEYGYRVRARDLVGNMTEWSSTVFATTLAPPDNDPPDPDPMQWDPTVDPNGFDGTPREILVDANDTNWGYGATMTAMVAVDAGGGPVEYYFECTTQNDFDSGWVATPTYTVLLGRSGQWHIFRVRARDQFNNMTAWSPEDRAD